MSGSLTTSDRGVALIEPLEPRRLFSGGGRHVHEFVTQTNIVSNGAVAAISTDPNLVNPWGVAYGPSSPFWIADNGKSVATVYDADGTIHQRVAAIPAGASGQSNP